MDQNKLNWVKEALLSMQRYSWEQGVAMQAFLELGDTRTVIQMAKSAAFRVDDKGRVAEMGGYPGEDSSVDALGNGEGMLLAAKLTGDTELQAMCEVSLEWALHKAPRNADGILYHVLSQKQMWVDSLYMVPPYLAAAGEYDEAMKQLRGFTACLLDPETSIYYHIWDDEKKIWERRVHWTVGNGWALAGIARVITCLPDSMAEEKAELIALAHRVLDAVLPYMNGNGLFLDEMDNPDSYEETNGAQMISYTIYRGILEGWLEEHYLKYAEAMRKAAEAKVDEYGFVCDVCGAPAFFKPGVAPEGNAFYILMECMAEHYFKKCGGSMSDMVSEQSK